MKEVLGKILGLSAKAKIIVFAVAVAVTSIIVCTAAYRDKAPSGPEDAQDAVKVLDSGDEEESGGMVMLAAQWPDCFSFEAYDEPEFIDDENRENNAFNVADFGEQGNNGWFYRYGNPDKPFKSRRMEIFDGEAYHQKGIDGLEIKKDFIHTGEGTAPILEWRAARQGAVNLKMTYVKNANGDQNSSWPDGVYIKIFKGRELLESHQVEIKVEGETLAEASIPGIEVEKGESLYIAVDPKNNNAFDGGTLYVAISDVNSRTGAVAADASRKDNNANNVKDFGAQGSNGWYYMYGKSVKDFELVSDETEDGFINNTSPGLVISKDFIHPAINDNAVLGWMPAVSGPIEIRGKYTKYEHNDGNPDWPDGVIVQIYLNGKKLFEEKVKAPAKGTNEIVFREAKLNVTPKDRLYFVINANGNSSYDGGGFNISILDRNGLGNEDTVVMDETETRQNIADVSVDFGAQGDNGWFFQEGYQDEPFGAYNIRHYEENEKYWDESYLEIKRDFVNTGEDGKSAVIKWKVAQDGAIKIDASYNKYKNEDKNPSWPDGTRVTLYHNKTVLVREEFPPDASKEIKKDLKVERLDVKKGDYITMVVNGKDNNAYDAGEYSFVIDTLSGLVGLTEKDIEVEDDRTNNASASDDFGVQGNNGWFYQYGYRSDPFYAVNVETYTDSEGKYSTKDGIEIKGDYIMPSTKDKSANVKWKVAQDGRIHIYVNYTKFPNEDSNPDWPDGTDVTVFHNSDVLKAKYFEPLQEEVSDGLSYYNLDVEKGDYITFMVNARKNTAYDGGRYYFVIEEADDLTMDKVNNSRVNKANLEKDFGLQGSNGWYYLEGRLLENSNLLARTPGEYIYESRKVRSKDLSIKSDFVQPGPFNDAMYQWVAAQDGEVDVTGQYTKFGHKDSNPNWPDGTKISVYRNHTELFTEEVPVSHGDGNDNISAFELEKLEVKSGDILTFSVNALNNNAWDGGRMKALIRPYRPYVFEPAPDNRANLEADYGGQGNEGWYYGFGNTSDSFKFADEKDDGNEYGYILHEQLLLKGDGVHPGKDVGAIYRWIAGESGKIDIAGIYQKSRNEGDSNTPDGVKVEVYRNGALIEGMSYDVAISKEKDTIQQIAKTGLDVERGDKIDFIITSKGNTEWDYGKLAMDISPSVDFKPDTDNNADLEKDYDGNQGSGGWYYGFGTAGNGFRAAFENNGEYTSAMNGKLMLKGDGVHPGTESGAIYRWIAGEDGAIDLAGAYYKSPNEGDNDIPDGVKVAVYRNGTLWEGMSYDVAVFKDKENVQPILKAGLAVKKGDLIDFVITAKENAEWDYGRLAMSMAPSVDFQPDTDNKADLAGDYDGNQGSGGWYYGFGAAGNGFHAASGSNGEFTSAMDDKLMLKGDGVHPGKEPGAIYRWIAGENGKIDLTGAYYKSPNEGDDNVPDGVKVAVYQNGNLIAGMFYDVAVLKDKENVQKIEKADLAVKKGDLIDFVITAKRNAEWDYGRLAVNITPSVDLEFEPDTDNEADLAEDYGKQGNGGWYYGFGTAGDGFRAAMEKNGEYVSALHEKLMLKGDGVHPGEDAGAIYRWVAGGEGKVSLAGAYYKSRNEGDSDIPDGVKVEVYLNGELLEGMSYDVAALKDKENVQKIEKEELAVKRGDLIDFVITAKRNAEWDYGRLAMSISLPVEYKPGEENNADLAADFGNQGSNGWYYGSSDWDGNNFKTISYNEAEQKYAGEDGLELKADFVHPATDRAAAYKWIAAEDGTIQIKGTYEKFANSADPNADGVTLRIVKNGEVVDFYGGSIAGNTSSNVTADIDKVLDVSTGDEIVFVVNSEGNNSYDGGKLSITIGLPEEPDTGRENRANLEDDFGEQGNNGWYYGFCDWDAKNFGVLSFADNKYAGENGLELKSDYVHPGRYQNAAYKWVAAEDGTIQITGEYVKYANDTNGTANGVTVRIFRNEGDENVQKFIDEADDGQKINVGGISSERKRTINETFGVQKGDEIIFAVNSEGNSSYDGGKLSINIAPAEDGEAPYTLREEAAEDKKDAQNNDGADMTENPEEGTGLEGTVGEDAEDKEDSENSDGADMTENPEEGADLEGTAGEDAEDKEDSENKEDADVAGKPVEGADPAGNAGEDAEDKEDAGNSDGTDVTGKPEESAGSEGNAGEDAEDKEDAGNSDDADATGESEDAEPEKDAE